MECGGPGKSAGEGKEGNGQLIASSAPVTRIAQSKWRPLPVTLRLPLPMEPVGAVDRAMT